MENKLQLITPNLWFNHEAEEAAKFYTSIFPNSEIARIARYGKAEQEFSGKEPGEVMTVEFFLDGQRIVALNGGPQFQFSEAISLIANCDNQEEIDYYWEKLTEGDDQKVQMCGWLKDKFGLSWQVVPAVLPGMMANANGEEAGRLMDVIQKTKKFDIKRLEQAYEGKSVRG